MNWFHKLENAIASMLFVLGIGISLYGVFMRYVIQHSQSWTTEIYTFLLVWAIFIGFGTALRDGEHIAIDLLYDRLNPALQKAVDVFVLLIGLAFSLFFIVSGGQMVLTAFGQDIETIDVGIPIWIPYLIMPLGGLLLFVHFCERAYNSFKGHGEGE